MSVRVSTVVSHVLEACIRLSGYYFFSEYLQYFADNPTYEESGVIRVLTALCTEYVRAFGTSLTEEVGFSVENGSEERLMETYVKSYRPLVRFDRVEDYESDSDSEWDDEGVECDRVSRSTSDETNRHTWARFVHWMVVAGELFVHLTMLGGEGRPDSKVLAEERFKKMARMMRRTVRDERVVEITDPQMGWHGLNEFYKASFQEEHDFAIWFLKQY